MITRRNSRDNTELIVLDDFCKSSNQNTVLVGYSVPICRFFGVVENN